jgi:LPS-assembly protein
MRYIRGHVRLETIDMLLLADEVDYDEDTGVATARGNVKFEHFFNGDRIECDHMVYNLDDETGKFYDVRGTSPSKIESRPGLLTTSNPFYFEGAWAERIHEKYILHSGFITDCRVPRPWWRLTGPTFDVIPGDRAIAYHAWFRIGAIPIFYAPAFYKSLKKQPRKSGFLTPNAGHSSTRGYMVGGAYFWAISRSYDAFLRVQYFTQRGPAETADFRGKITPGTDFNVSLYSVQDRGISIGTQADGAPLIQKQGGEIVAFQAKSVLPDGWTAKIDVNYLSSFLFRQSFSESFHEAIFSESRSVGFLTKHWDTYGMNFVADNDEQFQSTTPNDKIDIRKLPEFQFLSREHEIPNSILPLWFSLGSSAGLLYRNEPDYQTRQFVPRLDLNPSVETAFHWKGFSLMPTFSLRETDYGQSLNNYTVVNKNFVRSARELDVVLILPSLERVYKAPAWLGDKLKHVVESRAEYLYVGGITNFNDIIRFDAVDLMSDTSEIRYSLANRFFVKSKEGNVTEVLSWELIQARYFEPTFGGAVLPGQRNIVQTEEDITGFAYLDGPRNYSPISSIVRFQQRIGLEWRTDYDPLRHTIVNSGATVDARWAKYFVSFGEYVVKTDPVLAPSSNQIHGLIGYGNQNRKGWNGAFISYYDLKRGLVQFSTLEVTYNTDCCGISAEYRRFNIGTRDETQYLVSFAVSNIGTFGTLKKQERIF